MGNGYEIYVLLYVIKTVEGISVVFFKHIIGTSKVVQFSVAGG